jgi:hypothetical protein
MAAKSHKDVEFHVAEAAGQEAKVFKTFKEASERVVSLCISRGQAIMDVVVWSEAGARWLHGDDGVTQYEEDPDASVFERFEFKGNFVGRIP